MKKLSDYLIITACIAVVIIFLGKGLTGLGGMVYVDAADTTATPVPSDVSSNFRNLLHSDENTGTPTPTPAQAVPTQDPSTSPTPSPVLQATSEPSATPILTQTVVATPVPKPQRLEASYTGSTVVVGDKFDRSKLVVTVYYSNGMAENVTNYTVSSEVIKSNGSNSIIIMYEGLTAKASIYGRTLVAIYAACENDIYGVGNIPDSSEIVVNAEYSDGRKEIIEDEFEISPAVLEKEGKQEITVTYKGLEAKCYVWARKKPPVTAINVSHEGKIYTGCEINKKDFTVIAVYEDQTTEKIHTFQLSRDVFYDSGIQPLTITYGGVSKPIDLEVTERYITGIRAEYAGSVVVVGRKFRSDNLHVYIKYVDGAEEEITDYTIHTRKVRYIGTNTFTVYYGDSFSAEVIVEGTEYIKPNFDYVSSAKTEVDGTKITVDTAIPVYMEPDSTIIEGLEKKTVRKAYRKLGLKRGKFIAFEYYFADDNNELELPLTIRVTLPEGYDIDHSFLYYCPNKKTIMGRMNRTVIDDKTFECTLFKVGTYMLVNSPQLTEDEFETDETEE